MDEDLSTSLVHHRGYGKSGIRISEIFGLQNAKDPGTGVHYSMGLVLGFTPTVEKQQPCDVRLYQTRVRFRQRGRPDARATVASKPTVLEFCWVRCSERVRWRRLEMAVSVPRWSWPSCSCRSPPYFFSNGSRSWDEEVPRPDF